MIAALPMRDPGTGKRAMLDPSMALEFVASRPSPPIDAEQILAEVPQGTMIKRLVVDIALAQASKLEPGRILAEAGVTLPNCGPFENVSWHDYFRVLLVVAKHTHGPEQIGAGLRAIGRDIYPVVVRTPTGKLMLGRQLKDGLSNLVDTWQQFNTLGSLCSEFLAEREFEFHTDEYPIALAETVGVGLFEGFFKYHHTPVQLTMARLGPSRAIFRMHW